MARELVGGGVGGGGPLCRVCSGSGGTSEAEAEDGAVVLSSALLSFSFCVDWCCAEAEADGGRITGCVALNTAEACACAADAVIEPFHSYLLLTSCSSAFCCGVSGASVPNAQAPEPGTGLPECGLSSVFCFLGLCAAEAAVAGEREPPAKVKLYGFTLGR
jgi:hypothetical protein